MAAAQGRGVCSGGHFVPQLHQEAIRRRKQSESIVDLKTLSVKLRTMESVRTSFHAQLATVMDSLLAAAVCEIAKIFESSLCEQQAELVQKTEEIHLLRDKLEKEERRQKTKSGDSEDGETPPAGRDGSLIPAGSGVNVGNDASSHQDPIEGLSPNLSRLKEEVMMEDGASVKHECAASRPILGSVAVQAEDGGLAAGDQRQMDTLSVTRAKAKVSPWDQGPHSADHRPLQDQASAPFLSISQSGCCSPRPDPGLAQPGEWLSRLDATRGLENLQADGTSCSVPVSSSAGTDAPSFRPGYGPDEASNESDDDSFPYLDQRPVNQDSSQNSAQGQGMEQTEAGEDQSQTPSGESPWRPRGDRGGRINIGLTRRATTLGIRDPLRPQSLTLRHTNALSLSPAPGGGNVRPYTCPYCTKCFTYPSHQRRHLLRHTGVRLHPCQFCDKSFLTPSELTVHTRTHTGERPFGCAQCGKRFARSGNLRAHQRDVHMGKRPFACTECGKRFAHRGNLRVHNHRVHQGDPYYMEDQQEPDLGPNPV